MSAIGRLKPFVPAFPTTLTITSQPSTQPGPGDIFFHSDFSSDWPKPIFAGTSFTNYPLVGSLLRSL